MRIARVFFGIDMRCNFDGIRAALKKEKMDLATLDKNMIVICLNNTKTAFKILVDNTYIVYYKNGNRRIPLEALQYLPQKFGGSEMEYNQAVETSIRQKLNLPKTGMSKPKTGKRIKLVAEARA